MNKFLIVTAALMIIVSGIVAMKQEPVTSKSESTARLPSSNDKLNNDLNLMLEKVIEISDPTEVSEALNSVKEKAKRGKSEFSPALGAIAELIQENQGLIHRLKPLIEQNEVTSLVVTGALKAAAQNIPAETPWARHILDSLLLPTDKAEFKSIKEFQTYIVNNIVPKLENIYHLLDAKKSGKDQMIILHTLNLDHITNGKFAHLPSGLKSFKLTNAHVDLWSGKLSHTIGQIYYVTSYNLEDMPEIVSKLLKKRAKKSFFSDLSKKQSMAFSNQSIVREFFTESLRPKHKKFLVLHSWGVQNLTLSKSWIERGISKEISAQDLSKIGLKKNNASIVYNDKQLLNLLGKSNSALKEELFNLKATNGTVATHPATGKSIKFNAAAIFNATNPSIKDLKRMFPVNFHKNATKNTKRGEIIDLDYGKPTQWNDPTFGGVIPGAANDGVHQIVGGLIMNPSSAFVGGWLRLFL